MAILLGLRAAPQVTTCPWSAFLSWLFAIPRPAIDDGKRKGCDGLSHEPAETRSLVY